MATLQIDQKTTSTQRIYFDVFIARTLQGNVEATFQTKFIANMFWIVRGWLFRAVQDLSGIPRKCSGWFGSLLKLTRTYFHGLGYIIKFAKTLIKLNMFRLFVRAMPRSGSFRNFLNGEQQYSFPVLAQTVKLFSTVTVEISKIINQLNFHFFYFFVVNKGLQNVRWYVC